MPDWVREVIQPEEKTPMQSYRLALQRIMSYGYDREDRTGVGTRELFGIRMDFPDVGENFPLLTGKATHFKSVVAELTWFLKGLTNISYLHSHGCTIWDEWADSDGNVGPLYGHQWRRADGYDQLSALMHHLENDPYSRRHIVSAWNVSDLEEMRLPPCHAFWQCYVRDGGYLDLMLHQRSADMFLGVPFNIASYAALMHCIARPLGLEPGNLVINLGAAHVYQNHFEQTLDLLGRDWPKLPKLQLNRTFKNLGSYEVDDFELIGYTPLPKITAPVAV
jgi:thymidylate synthase